jgi:hypothetical protein
MSETETRILKPFKDVIASSCIQLPGDACQIYHPEIKKSLFVQNQHKRFFGKPVRCWHSETLLDHGAKRELWKVYGESTFDTFTVYDCWFENPDWLDGELFEI